MADPQVEELISLNYRLLEAIDKGEWDAYAKLCDPTITCFEPEAEGHLVAGMDFHQFYFKLEGPKRSKQSTISSPHVRIIGDAAVVSYVRVVQRVNEQGVPVTVAANETRIWQRHDGSWRNVHFHRSPC